jgi:hypothetical protein
MEPLEQRFLELAHKDITDQDMFEELCYVYAKSRVDPTQRMCYFENFKKTRKSNPSLTNRLGPDDQHLRLDGQMARHIIPDYRFDYMDKYETKKRIKSLEQTLAMFMEQTKVERFSQEAVIQSLSKEVDEFQEEFYDCQSEVQDQKEQVDLFRDALKETIEMVERLETEIHKIKKCIPFTKDKIA